MGLPRLRWLLGAPQLRDLVPPQSHNSAVQDATDSKRPKHVVLSDTIALVRELQSKVAPGHALVCTHSPVACSGCALLVHWLAAVHPGADPPTLMRWSLASALH